MGVVIISCVGTSLLQNFVRCNEFRDVIGRYRDRGVEEWYRLSVDDERNRYPDGYICSVTRRHELYDAMKSFVERYWGRSCAEINGIEAIAKLYSIDLRGSEIVLLPTETCNSMLCANIIGEALRDRYSCRIDLVPLRSLRSVDEFDDLVIEILDKVVKRIVNAKRDGARVFINATPGFKAEVSFLTLASILAGADAVVYIHEAFREGVSLPIPPIKLDLDYTKKILSLFGDSQCIDYGYALQILDEPTIISYIDRGIVYRRYGELCIRKWVRKLLEVYSG